MVMMVIAFMPNKAPTVSGRWKPGSITPHNRREAAKDRELKREAGAFADLLAPARLVFLSAL